MKDVRVCVCVCVCVWNGGNRVDWNGWKHDMTDCTIIPPLLCLSVCLSVSHTHSSR